VYAPRGHTVNEYNLAFSHYLFLVLLVFLVCSCSVRLCCFEEKSIRVNLTRQGSIKFHVSYQVFVRTPSFLRWFCHSLSGGEVHHQDPLCLVCGLMPWWRVWLNRGSGLLAGKLDSPWHCPLLGGGLLSVGVRLLPPPPPMMSMTSLKREAGVWPRRRHPQGTVVVA
jgi:hypothetical protein